MFERKLTTLGKQNKATLREFAGRKRMSEEEYLYALEAYNAIVTDTLKSRKQAKNILNNLPEFVEQNQLELKQKRKEQQKQKEISNLQKQIEKSESSFYKDIINTEFINTTASSQISDKFAISEFSMKTRYSDFYERALNKYKLNKLYKKLNDTEFDFDIQKVEQLFKNMYNILMSHAGQYNRIYITNNDTGVVKSSKLQGDIDYEQFSDVLSKIVQSAGIAVLGDLTFTIQQRNMPKGGSCNIIDVPQFLKDKRGISIILNDDDLCGQRCLVLSDCKNIQELTDMKKEKSKSRFNNKLIKLCNELELKSKMSFVDFEKYANSRQKQVIILSGLFVVMYETATEYQEQVYIYYDTAINHYHFIHDINSASNDSKRHNKWCRYCKKSIRRENFDKHKCKETICGICNKDFCSIIEKDNHFKSKSWVLCDVCNLYCPNQECYEGHLKKCKGDVKRCLECKKFCKVEHYEKHICGEKLCKNCDEYYTGEHRCFIKPLNDYIIQDGKIIYPTWVQDIYAYDFESMFDENNNHIVNLCIVKKLFSDEEYSFNNIEEFVKFCIKCKNSTFIAHNGKAYDNWLVHKYLIKHTAHRPNKLILAGNKIMYMKVKSIRFIDSLNHIAQSLSTFPKTFGLKELKKGFFPYLFNTKENQEYIGKIPDIKYFNTDAMTIDKYKEFCEWYSNQKNIVYNFKNELYEYCNSDVDILKRSLEIYINDGISTNGINPLKCSTIASYCLRVFRTNFLKENKIAILTKEEYDFCKRGFFGGRTEVFKLFKSWTESQIKEGTYGKYVDIQSLYPTVQFYDDLPCGIPKWDLNPKFNYYDNGYEYVCNNYGYIECDIECPDNLHIPLLPEKKNNKLIFDLTDKSKKVYSSIELKRAIEVGYKIKNIYKALIFDKCNDLFKGYIQTFLKIKTESNGYEGDDIDAYIERYYNSCGVKLEKEKIKKNSGMKLLAKICLNSLWGKFGQNDELPTTEYIKNDAWFRLLKRHSENKVELKNEVLIDEDTLYVSYIEKEESQTSLTSTNLALAGFTTANARLRLYKELYKLGERVIYCDTDSIIYEYRKNEYNVKEGDCLGEWELEDDGELKEVYALAPKTYGYVSITGKQSYKCKGITLNYGNKSRFTYDKLKNLITDEKHESIITLSDDFIKDKKSGNIYTKYNVEKITSYNVSDFKRNFNINDGSSQPFKN